MYELRRASEAPAWTTGGELAEAGGDETLSERLLEGAVVECRSGRGLLEA